MKKNIFFLILALIYLSACNDVKKTQEYIDIQTENDSLKVVEQQNEEINLFISDFNEIQADLNQIREKERWITVNSKRKDPSDAKKRIKEDINFIYSLLKENISKVKALNKKIAASNSKNKALRVLVKNLQQQILSQSADIIELNKQLRNLNLEIMTLDGELDEAYALIAERDQVIQNQKQSINTAYYVVGTAKELKKNKVITRQGGFIGIGRQSKIDNDFNKDYFTKVNILDFKQVPVFARKIKLISTHPKNSYELIKGKSKIDYLVIVDKKAFWSVSKYLVIEVKK